MLTLTSWSRCALGKERACSAHTAGQYQPGECISSIVAHRQALSAGYRRHGRVIQTFAEATGAAMISTTGLGLDGPKL